MQRRRRGSSNSNSMQAQINRLTQAVNQLAVAPRQGRSRSRRRRTPAVQAISAPAANTQAVRRNRSRTPGRSNIGGSTLNLGTTGTIRFSNREIFRTIKLDKSKSELKDYAVIDAKDFGFLSKLGGLFGRMRWNKLAFFYESATASDVGGTLAYGIDWGVSVTAPTSITNVTTLNPSISHTLWALGAKLNVNPRFSLNSRVWYDVDATEKYDSALASMLIYAQATSSTDDRTFGYIWIEYDVEFQGPKL